MKFKGKIGWWWWFVLASLTFSTFDIFQDFEGFNFFTLILRGLILLVYIGFWYMVFKNYALVEKDVLTIYLGPFKTTIPILEILSIRKTYNPLSSMAISFDRLEIRARKTSVMIALKDEQGFADAICMQNPTVEVKLKRKRSAS